MRSLNEIQENWEAFAQADPMWAICTDARKRGHRWTKEEFFATGEREISRVMDYLHSLNLFPPETDTALDFGCGVGRLTRALSKSFVKCCGVDISPTMIKLATEFHKDNPRCNFRLNEADHLQAFQDGRFGFIYTSITLQHIPVEYMQKYVLELIRVLKPGGVLVFQIPDSDKRTVPHRVENFLGVRRNLKRVARALFGKRPEVLRMDMNCLSEERVRDLVCSENVRIVDVKLTNSAQRSFNGDLQFLDREVKGSWVSKQYCLVKLA
jgi:SAM-dependent methyltransferase